MKKKAVICGITLIMSACILCSCGQMENVTIQLGDLQDVLSWNDGVVWNTEEDVFVRGKTESLQKSIFQDPFYEKEEKEEISLQYIDKRELYYIRTTDSRYYELCRMDLDRLRETVLYANGSEAERKYDYLGLNGKTETSGDERWDMMQTLIRKFCVIGDVIYMMDQDTLYAVNRWTKYKRILDGDLDPDTELVFIGSNIYYKSADQLLMEYDRKSGEKTCVSDGMVRKLCICGGGLLVQRMNGEFYRFHADQEIEKLTALSGRLLQGSESYFYCVEEDGNKLVVYDANTRQVLRVITGENIWGVAESGEVIYYLEAGGDGRVLREAV